MISHTADVLAELAALAEHSVKARARIAEYLDTRPVIATLEVDFAATARAGHTVSYDEPTQGLLDALAAIRIVAANEERDALAGTEGHERTPRSVDGLDNAAG
jgi:hypothetical protein